MFNSKTLLSIQTLLLLSQCVLGQSLTANSSLYLPGDGTATIDPAEVIIARPISVSGSATVYEVVASDATLTQTYTLALNPSGASLHAVQSAAGAELDVDETCTFTGDNSVCQLVEVEKLSNATTTVTTSTTATFTEPISSVPVVALALQTTAAPSPTSPAPTTTNTAANTPKNSALSPSISRGLVTLITFGLVVKLL